MTKRELYLAIKNDLINLTYEKSTGVTETVSDTNIAIWRNQVGNAGSYTGSYPAIFVEFLNTQYSESNSKVYQSYDLVLRLHLCRTTTDNETDTLANFNFADAVFKNLQLKQYGDFAPMKRRAESVAFSYDTVQNYIQDYLVGQAKDYGADKRLTTDFTIENVVINKEITNDI